MFVKSYNETHPENNISCNGANADGYTYSNDTNLKNDYHEIYIKSDYKKADGMWLASPSNNYFGDLVATQICGDMSEGFLFNGYYNNNGLGIRPLICLKSEVQLTELSQEEYDYEIIPAKQ